VREIREGANFGSGHVFFLQPYHPGMLPGLVVLRSMLLMIILFQHIVFTAKTASYIIT